jgi:hypothetical protein
VYGTVLLRIAVQEMSGHTAQIILSRVLHPQEATVAAVVIVAGLAWFWRRRLAFLVYRVLLGKWCR